MKQRPAVYIWEEPNIEGKKIFILYREEGIIKSGPRGEYWGRGAKEIIYKTAKKFESEGYLLIESKPQEKRKHIQPLLSNFP